MSEVGARAKQKVQEAFEQLATRQEVVMPQDIALVAGVNKTTVYWVLRDASWWDSARREATKAEIRKRAYQSRLKKHYTGRGFSRQAAERLKQAFDKLENNGLPYSQRDLAVEANLCEATVSLALRHMAWWTDNHRNKAQSAWKRRSQDTNRDNGYKNLANYNASQFALGYPHLVSLHASFALTGNPGLRKGRETQKALGYPVLKHSREQERVKGYPSLQKAAAVLKAEDYMSTRRASQKRVGSHLAPTHPAIIKSSATRIAILQQICTYCLDSQLNHHPSIQWIADHISRSSTVTYKHIKRLREMGLIDRTNRPLVNLTTYLSQNSGQPIS